MSRDFFNGRAASWDEKYAEKDILKLTRLTDALKINPGSNILDVGTGTGTLLPFLERKIGDTGSIIALDYSEKMISEAKAKSTWSNVDFLVADITCVPLQGGLFDYVVCYSSFPHFEDKAAALREIYRLLREGGALYICHTSSRSEINRLHHGIPEVHRHMIPDAPDMKILLTGAGFESIHIKDSDGQYLSSAVKPS